MESSSDAEYTSDEEEAAMALAPGPLRPEDEEEDGDEDVDMDAERAARGQQASARPPIYNADALHDKLEDLAWDEDVPWEETLALTSSAATQVQDVDDDLERELAFYNQALAATRQAIGRFEAAGQAWRRPADYYAEMVKSDAHMARVKAQLIHEQQQIEGAEERRKQREAKRYGKAVQAERTKEKAQAKKAAIAGVSRLRRQRARGGYAGDLDLDAELAAMDRPPRPAGATPGQRIRPDERKVGKKREAKNARYGFGGPKRRSKQNDATSAADMDGYRPGSFDDGVRGGGRGSGRGGGRGRGGRGRGRSRGSSLAGGRGGGGTFRGGVKKKAGGNRPGKARRQAARGGRG